MSSFKSGVPIKNIAGLPTPMIRQYYAKAKLATTDDVCHELAKLYREARNGRIDVADASRLANVLSILSRIMVDGDIESRVEALEQNRMGF